MIILGIIAVALSTLIVYGAYLLFFSFTLWMVVDAAKQDRFWWVVLILGIPVVGSAAYYFTEKKHEYVKAESHHVHASETEAQHETSHNRRPKLTKADRADKGKEHVEIVEESKETKTGTSVS